MTKSHQWITDTLDALKKEGRFRTLRIAEPGAIDFSSNDYLGLARSEKLLERTKETISKYNLRSSGATGSRLLSGQSTFYDHVEKHIAEFHGAESALIFNSGYDANVSLLSALPSRGDTIIADELSHASIRDGMSLSTAKTYKFKHNNLDDLKAKISRATGKVFVAAESLYSMDGDGAPLQRLSRLCGECGAYLIVDEAHSTGVFGQEGRGLVFDADVQNVFARVHTFGKALGVHGAAVLCDRSVREYLINFARPFIYSTALPPHSLAAIFSAYELLPSLEEERKKLYSLISLFREKQKNCSASFLESESPIQGILVSGNESVKGLAESLQSQGFSCRPILSPTVPVGRERIRICLHSFNTEEEIEKLVSLISREKA